MHFTTRTKITLLFTLLVAGILIFLDIIIFKTADHAWQRERQEYITKVMDAMYTPEQAKEKLQHVEIRDWSGVIIHRQWVFLYGSGTLHSRGWLSLGTDTFRTGTQSYITASESKMGFTITTAEDITEQVSMRDDTIRTAFLISLFAIFWVSIIGYFFSWYMLSPIRRMKEVSEKFSLWNKTDSHDVNVKWHKNDEVVILARSLESLFTRVKKEGERLEQFSDDIAHEIKNKLFALESSLDLAIHTEHREHGITKAKKMINELSWVVDSLLFFARNEKREMHMTDMWNLIFTKFDGIDSRIHIERGEKVSKRITPELFLTAIGNIISNAQKFTPPDGRIDIRVTHIWIEIQDTGMGIRKSDLPHIFDRLWKADTSRSHGSGYGLGLSIAKKIIEEFHGMKLSVESEEGKGTRFLIEWK